MADEYRGPERRRHASESLIEYRFSVLDEKLIKIDSRLEKIDDDLGEMRIKQVYAGILGAIAGALPSLIAALFMYFSFFRKA